MSWPQGQKTNSRNTTSHSPAACPMGLNYDDLNALDLYLFFTGNDRKLDWAHPASYSQCLWGYGSPVNSGDSTPESLTACVFRNRAHLFWKSNDEGNHLYHSTYSWTETWVPPVINVHPGYYVYSGYWNFGQMINPGDSSAYPPVPVVFDDQLYLFWTANDSSHRIYYSALADGKTWPAGAKINNIDSTPCAPAVGLFGNKLYVFWKAASNKDRIYYSASGDGVSWPAGKTINNIDSTPKSPSVATFNGKLYVFWKANDTGNKIYHSSCYDGANWPAGSLINNWDTTPEAPAACAFNNKLYVFWSGGDNYIYAAASATG